MIRYLILICLIFSGCKSMYPDKRCRLKPDQGPCDGSIEKYYYDQVEKRCKPFMWGGCHGVVPFDFIEECEACIQETEG